MKKLNHSAMIVCIAASLIILGVSAVLSFRFGIQIGLPIGLGAFFLLIVIMVIVNHKISNSKQ